MRSALLIALVVAAVACGAGRSASAETTPATQLTISFWPAGRGTDAPQRWTLRCAPAGGTLPRAAAVCRQLAALPSPFAPRRKNLICTDQYGGPQEAVIAGNHKGERVWTTLRMRNGCEISRAKRLAFLVPGFSANPNS